MNREYIKNSVKRIQEIGEKYAIKESEVHEILNIVRHMDAVNRQNRQDAELFRAIVRDETKKRVYEHITAKHYAISTGQSKRIGNYASDALRKADEENSMIFSNYVAGREWYE